MSPRIRARTALLFVIAPLWACTAGTDAPGRAEVLLAEVMEMRRTGEIDGVPETFLPEAAYDDYGNSVQYRGWPEIADHLAWVHTWADDVFLDVLRVHPGEGTASAEWVLEGVQTAPIPGQLQAVTGRRFRISGVTLVEVERGAVARAADYMDLTPFLLDLGAEITLPDGSVLSLPDPGGGPD